jgi:hypothetical protein
MSWGTRRRNIIISILFFLFFIPIALISVIIFYDPPTCFDSVRNGDEAGIDCGGSCVLLCAEQATEPVVLWERAFRVQGGLHNLISYIENPNPTAFVRNAPYVFKIYNEENILITEIKGSVSIPPKTALPVIQNNIQLYEQIVSRVTFEFTDTLVYEQTSPQESLILIKEEIIENEQTSPRVRAKIQNLSLRTIEDIDVIVIVYDTFDSVIGVSSTYVAKLLSEEVRDIVFTWPQPLSNSSSRIEIIPLYDFK